MNERQTAALVDPLNDADQFVTLNRHRYVTAAERGVMLITILAVDR